MNPAILMLALPMVLLIALMYDGLFGKDRKDESRITDSIRKTIEQREEK